MTNITQVAQSARDVLLPAYKRIARSFSALGLKRFGLARAADSFIRKRLEFVEIEGHKLLVDPLDSLDLRGTNGWEPFETEVIKRLVRPGDTALDLGAMIGYHTLLLARLVGGEGRVFAFEPAAENFRILRKNVKIQGYRNVVLVRKAVSDVTGVARLYLSHENNGDHRLYDSKDGRRSVQVECIRPDDYFRGVEEKINFIKIDVQGAEFAAVSGMKSILASSADIAFVTEFWPIGLKRFGTEPGEYLKLLRDLDFHLYEVDESRRIIVEVEDPKLLDKLNVESEDYTNILCLRRPLDSIEIPGPAGGGVEPRSG